MAESDAKTIPDDVIRDFSQSVISEVLTPENLTKVANKAEDLGANLFKLIFAGTSVLLSELLSPVIEGVLDGQKFTEGTYQRIAAKALNAMLDAGINTGDIQVFGKSEQAAQKIGAAMFRAFGTATTPLQPSDANAKQLAATLANMTVESWLTKLVFTTAGEVELCGLIDLESAGELGEKLQEALGLNRAARRAFAPYIDAVVVTPFRWQVNKTFRPELLTLSQAARQVLRGRKSTEQFLEEGRRAGLPDDDIEAVLNAARQKLTIDDWLFLERAGVAPASVVDNALADLGCDEPTRNWLRAVDREKRRVARNVAIATEVEKAYVDGRTTETSLLFALGQAYPDADEREGRRSLVEAQRFNRTQRVSHGEIKDAVKRGILSMFDYRKWLQAENYDEDSALTLELLLRDDINAAEAAQRERDRIAAEKAAETQRKAAEAAQRRAELEARQAAQIPPLNDIKAAVIRGLVSIDRFRESLVARGYSAGDIEFLVTMLAQDRQARIDQENARAGAGSGTPDRQLTLAQLEEAVLAEHLGLAEYGQRLKDLGFKDADRALLVALLTDKLQAQADAERIRRETAERLAKRGLNLAQAERATRLHVWTPAQFRAWLTTAGLDDVAIATLAATMDAELAADAAAEARRARIEAELQVKGISLAQLESAVLRGVTSMTAYRQRLQAAGYPPADVELLVGLLQARLDDVVAQQRMHDEAAARAAARPLSLAQLERAVILGTVTLDAYWDYLGSLGFDDDDRAILQANLVRALQEAREREQTHDQLVDGLGNAADDIRAIERANIDAAEDLDAYRTALRNAGMTEAGVATCVAWLTDRINDRRDAERFAETVEAALRKQGLSLVPWKDAVLAGERSLLDYGAFLAAQGYGAADVAVLVALLDAHLADERPA